MSGELTYSFSVLATVKWMMDCNFRSKNVMNKSTKETSPYLGDGMAYMVPEEAYDEFTQNSAYQDEVRIETKTKRTAAIWLSSVPDVELFEVWCYADGQHEAGKGDEDHRYRGGVLHAWVLLAKLRWHFDKGGEVRGENHKCFV